MSDEPRTYTVSDSHWTGISCSCCNGERAKRGRSDMTSKPVTGVRIKDGKVIKTPPRMAAGHKRNKQMQAARLEKQWKGKSK